jgi:hypothetical protein
MRKPMPVLKPTSEVTHCPRCKAELPRSKPPAGSAPDPAPTARTPEEALRADTPPAPCPQCGWSTMWNE